jgi:MerR family transcriptional regulator, thiopeptide resistance regulator
MFEKHWKIGELARATGLTVRTLHHYDVIGLLVPSERTQAGYRLYGEQDVRRLYEIRALRDLGIPLGEIPDALDGDVRDTIGRHLERVEHELEQSRRLRSLLQRILDADTEASSHDYMEAIEAMTMFEKYYTPEQLEQLEQRRQALGEDAIKAVEQEWKDLYAEVRAHREGGTDPGDPAVQALVRRSGELIRMFTGGDPGIEAGLKRMYEQEGPARASRGVADPADLEYLERARAASPR